MVRISREVHQIEAGILEALAADEELYQQANRLIHVIRHDGSGEAFAADTPIIEACPLSYLITRASLHAVFMRPTKRGSATQTEPPVARVRGVLESGAARERTGGGHYKGIRRLDGGVIESPSLRPDGTVIQEPGYDEATRCLYAPNASFPHVPDAPSHSDAVRGYALLREVFQDFPYVAESHLSAVVAAPMTLLARPAIRGAVPCWVFDASSKRSGKSRQTDAISIIATGRPASRTTYPEDEEELEKVIAGYAVAGARIINLDNVARAFGGAALDKVITATDSVDVRVLGRTGQLKLPWRALVMASGNNIQCRGDMLPRVLAPRLESPLENPETRPSTAFKHYPLLQWVSAERPRLVAAALTILRAWIVAGRPGAAEHPWGGFEEWAALIPPALIWVGAPDPMGARRGLAGDEDPKRIAEGALVGEWHRLCEEHGAGKGLTVSEAIAHIYPAPGPDKPPDGWDALREAIGELTGARNGYPPGSRQVGEALRQIKARPIDGRKLVAEVAARKVARWRTVPVST